MESRKRFAVGVDAALCVVVIGTSGDISGLFCQLNVVGKNRIQKTRQETHKGCLADGKVQNILAAVYLADKT